MCEPCFPLPLNSFLEFLSFHYFYFKSKKDQLYFSKCSSCGQKSTKYLCVWIILRLQIHKSKCLESISEPVKDIACCTNSWSTQLTSQHFFCADHACQLLIEKYMYAICTHTCSCMLSPYVFPKWCKSHVYWERSMPHGPKFTWKKKKTN